MPVAVEITPAVLSAIEEFAPVNPLQQGEIDTLAAKKINQWRTINPSVLTDTGETLTFSSLFDPLAEKITTRYGQEGVNKLRSFLLFEASIMATHRQPPGLKRKDEIPPYEQVRQNIIRFEGWRIQAGIHLLVELTTPGKDIIDAWNSAWDKIRLMELKTAVEVSQNLESLFPIHSATAETFGLLAGKVLEPTDEKRQKFEAQADVFMKEVLQERQLHPDFSLLRIMRSLFDKMNKWCIENGIPNLWVDLSLGDVSGASWPLAIREAVALYRFGEKGRRVSDISQTYLGLLNEAGGRSDPHCYDGAALGWPQVRDDFADIARILGLVSDEKPILGSMLDQGSSGVIPKVAKIIDQYFKETRKNSKETVFLFHNPGFKSVATYVRNAGYKVIEFSTDEGDRFQPTATTVRPLLEKLHDKYNIAFIHTPVSNPTAETHPIESVRELDAALAEYGVVKVIDGAYLDTGEPKDDIKHKYGSAISDYSGPIIYMLSASKAPPMGPEPGLRLGWAGTPTKELAKYFMSVAQGFNLGNSYALQAEALARIATVGRMDLAQEAIHITETQQRFLRILNILNDKLVKSGKAPIIDDSGPVYFERGIYVNFRIHIPPELKNADPLVKALHFVARTGLVIAPWEGFWPVGAEGIPDGMVRATVTKELIPDIEDLFE